MKVNPDQQKRVIYREVIHTQQQFSIELVTFEIATGMAFGCRIYSNIQSRITDLYNTRDEAIREVESMPIAYK